MTVSAFDRLRETWARLVAFLRRDARDRDFADELTAHVGMAIDDAVAHGASREEARRRALVRLGGLESAKQRHRDARGLPSLEALMHDVRHGLRTLRRQPGFTAAAVATLAIGIGATTAIFSVVNATLLRPLPYPNADRLVDIRTRYSDGRVTTGLVASIELDSLRRLDGVVEQVGGYTGTPIEVTLLRPDAAPATVGFSSAGGGFFAAFGLPLTLGRDFTAEELAFVPKPPPPVAILSHRAWRALFNSDPDIIGASLRFGEFVTGGARVVGVAGAALDMPRGVDLWINARLDPQSSSHTFDAVVRLRPGVGIEQLRAAANAALVEIARIAPNNVGREYVLQPFLASVVGDLRPVVLVVLGATVLLLVLACVNVTNLLLARGLTQAQEIAMRSALGASRGRVVAQLLTQSMTLAAGGAAAGLAVAYAATRVLLLLGGSHLPRLDSVPFDWRVLAFSLTTVVVCGLGMGLAPALRLSATDLKSVLAEAGRRTGTSGGTRRLMSSLIVAEVALAIAVVAGAGWLIRSFLHLSTTDPGFIADGRLLIDVRAGRRFGGPAETEAWQTELLSRVSHAAGGATVGAANSFPFQIDRDGTTNIEVAGIVPNPARPLSSRMRIVTAGFVEAMGIRRLAGRTFTNADRRDAERVVVVNRAFVTRFFPDRDPVGASIAMGFPTVDREHPWRVVGVVDDVRYKSLIEPPEATIYFPRLQLSYADPRQAVVVATGERAPAAVTASVRAALQQFDSQLVATFTPVPEVVAATLERQQLGLTLMLVFGLVALVLAAVGLYGVITYVVSQRRAEMATRMALGASAAEVFWLVMSGGQRLVALGLVSGLALAYLGGRVASGMFVAVRATDPLVLAGAAATVAVTAWLATMVPALRASREDPARALRAE